jgi:hypothetical protein
MENSPQDRSKFTSINRSSLNVESDCDCSRRPSTTASTARAATSRCNESAGAPAGRNNAIARGNGCQQSGITPSQVRSAQRHARILIVLFGQASIGRCVFLHHSDKSVSPVLDSGSERCKSSGGRSVCANGDGGRELLEEGERGSGDIEGALCLPDNKSVVELFRDGQGGKVPRLASHKHKLKLTQTTLNSLHFRYSMSPRDSGQWRQHWARQCQS